MAPAHAHIAVFLEQRAATRYSIFAASVDTSSVAPIFVIRFAVSCCRADHHWRCAGAGALWPAKRPRPIRYRSGEAQQQHEHEQIGEKEKEEEEE
jgi:hypothetical protein